MNEQTWLSAHLFYAEPWEEFLIKAVDPFVHEMIESETAEQFFFIRYWERGPHIRLRFKGQKEKIADQLKPAIETYFSNYFSAYPSERLEPVWTSKLAGDQQWFPNNSVRFIDYEPEVERYGGPAGILISERQFELSSRCVLEVIRNEKLWNYSRALGIAIQLHVAFCHAVNMSLDETIAFFEWLSHGLMPYITGVETDLAAARQKAESIHASFNERFDKNKNVLVSFCKALWDALQEHTEFEDGSLNDWVRGMELTYREIRHTWEKNRLDIPVGFRPAGGVDVPEERQKLWFIYSSYVHMTNNRLGILNQDEAYVAFLIGTCLDSDEKGRIRRRVDVKPKGGGVP